MKSHAWYCTNCCKPISPRGVGGHNAMHRRRHDGPVVYLTGTRRITYDFRENESK